MAKLDVEPVFALKFFGEICQNNVVKNPWANKKNERLCQSPKIAPFCSHGNCMVSLLFCCALFGDEINTRVWVWDIPLYIYMVIP